MSGKGFAPGSGGMSQFFDPNNQALMGMAQGLLQSSGASPRPISFGEAMGNGLQGMQQGYMQGQNMQLRQQAMQMQEAEAQMKQDELKRRLADQEAMRQVLGKFQGGGSRKEMSNALISSGVPALVEYGIKIAPKVKMTKDGYDSSGRPVVHNIFDSGETESTGISPAARLMQVNQGSQIGLLDPYTGQARGALGVGMSPGEGARLAQSERQFQQGQGMEMLKLQELVRNRIAQQQRPKLQDGYWVSPPTADNPSGMMQATQLATAPKGSEAERVKLSGKVADTLGDDTEKLIKEATGSTFGSARDTLFGLVGASTDAAEAAGVLKARAATLAGNMPRFEGPQSDADRKYYLEMVGNIGDPSTPEGVKLRALKELKRIHKLADINGSVKSTIAPGQVDMSNPALWGEVR